MDLCGEECRDLCVDMWVNEWMNECMDVCVDVCVVEYVDEWASLFVHESVTDLLGRHGVTTNYRRHLLTL